MVTSIHQLPPESLSHIFAHLSPDEMLLSTLVCQTWYNLIKDDSCWQAAFEIYFKIQSSQEFNQTLQKWETNSKQTEQEEGRIRRSSNQFTRIDPTSWKNEYLIRFKLLRKWKKSKLGTITYNPSIGPITETHLNHQSTESESPNLTITSLKSGTTIRLDPWTRKLTLPKLECNPTDPPIPVHLTNHLDPICFSLNSEGNQVFWGMRNGEIRVCRCDEVSGGSRVDRIGSDESRHTLAINCLKSIQVFQKPTPIQLEHHRENELKVGTKAEVYDFLVSCSLMGDLKIWTIKNEPQESSSSCLGTVFLNDSEGFNGIGNHISFAITEDENYHNILVVGTQNGSIHLWTGLRFFNQDSTTNIFTSAESYQIINPIETNLLQSINVLEIDGSGKPSLLVQRGSNEFFERHWISNDKTPHEGSNDDKFLKYGNQFGSLSSLTCIQQDFHHHRFQVFSRLSKPSTSIKHPRWNLNSKRNPRFQSDSKQNQASYQVVSGDRNGKTYLWSWRMDDLDGLEVGSCMKPPLMCLQESGALVTSILITPMLIAIGGQDGMTKVYDALTGELLRLFGDKKTCKERSRMSQRTSGGSETELNEIHQRFKVTTIGLDHDSIFIGLGELMMVWKIDRIHQPKPKKDLRSKVPGRVVSKRIGSSNFREIQDEVIDTQEIDRIKLESKEKEEELKRRYYGEFSEWMNEEELIEYMKMISIEENGNRIEGDEEWETWKETEVVGIEERDGRSDVDESSLVMRASGSGDGEFEGLKDELNLDDWPLMIEGRGARERRGSNGNSPWKKKKRWIQVD